MCAITRGRNGTHEGADKRVNRLILINHRARSSNETTRSAAELERWEYIAAQPSPNDLERRESDRLLVSPVARELERKKWLRMRERWASPNANVRVCVGG